MGERAVEYDSADWIGVLTLNRPDQRNAMSLELLDAFSEQIALQRDDLGKPSRTEDAKEGISAVLQKREPEFRGK